jgi:hypothetical protein
MADTAGAVSVLEAGAAILASVLSPAGFTFELTSRGTSSGGGFAAGRFTRGGQYLEVHLRHSLGQVTYGWDGAAIAHADYLRGLGVTGAYPGYSDDPVDGFRHLAQDLAGRYRGSWTAIAAAMNSACKRPGSRGPGSSPSHYQHPISYPSASIGARTDRGIETPDGV